MAFFRSHHLCFLLLHQHSSSAISVLETLFYLIFNSNSLSQFFSSRHHFHTIFWQFFRSLIPQVSHSPSFSSFAALSQTFDLWLTFHEIKVSARIRDVSSVASSRRGHLWGVTSVSSISPSVLRNLLVCQKGKTSHQFILPKHCSGNSPWQGCPELHPQTSHQTILQTCFPLKVHK